jgi:hypothetical protein
MADLKHFPSIALGQAVDFLAAHESRLRRLRCKKPKLSKSDPGPRSAVAGCAAGRLHPRVRSRKRHSRTWHAAKSDLSGGWGVDIDVEISPIGVAGDVLPLLPLIYKLSNNGARCPQLVYL